MHHFHLKLVPLFYTYTSLGYLQYSLSESIYIHDFHFLFHICECILCYLVDDYQRKTLEIARRLQIARGYPLPFSFLPALPHKRGLKNDMFHDLLRFHLE